MSHVLPVEAVDAAVKFPPRHLLPGYPPVELRHREAALRAQLSTHRLDKLLVACARGGGGGFVSMQAYNTTEAMRDQRGRTVSLVRIPLFPEKEETVGYA